MRRSLASAVLAAAVLAPAAAPADLLVTRDGATLETRGPWRVEGRQVVFTLPNGSLSSLRVERVDLDQSALATARAAEEAARPAAEAAEPAALREPVLRITEADIPPMLEEGEGGEAAEGQESSTAAAGDLPLEVVSWERVPLGDGDGVQIFGTLRNNGAQTVVAPALSVSVYGEDGGLLALDEAAVNLTAIPAGRTANFRAEFPGLPDFAAVRFIPAGRGYEGRPPTTEETTDDEAETGAVELDADLPLADEYDAPPPD